MARRRVLVLVAALATMAATLAVGAPPPVAAATGGSITIVVDTNPADGTDVGFTGCQGSACGPFVLDDDTDPTRADRTTATDLAPATYTITQDAVAGWTFKPLSCSTSAGVTKDTANRRVTIALTAGQNVTCTFTNESPSITIVQDTSPDDTRDFGYTGCLGSGCGTFALDDDTDPTLPDTVTAGGLALGTYTITQSPDSLWSLSSLTCNSSSGVTIDKGLRRVTIVLSSASTHPTCTFTDATQSITIVDDDLTDSGQDHIYTGCGTGGCSTFTLDDDTDATHPRQHSSGPVPRGTYTIVQDAVTGWELTGLTCTGESTDILTRTGTVTLTAGENPTCTFTNRPPPAPLTDVADVTVGHRHACARLTDGQARCWGDKVLGNGAYDAWTTPQVVVDPTGVGPLTGVVDIAAGNDHTCAALEDGRAVCWGANAAGEVGNGTTDPGPLPVTTPSVVLDEDGTGALTGVVAVAAGYFRSCAVLESGEARCWGDGTSGALGNGSVTGSSLPVPVMDGAAPLTDVEELATGAQFSCARLTDATVRCWGYQGLGNASTGQSFSPVPVSDPSGNGPLTGATSITADWEQACAGVEDGQVACWGWVPLGGPSPTLAPVPVFVTEPGSLPVTGATSVAAGDRHSCLSSIDGGARCWGSTLLGLGAGPPVWGGSPSPVTVIEQATGAPLTHAASVSAGFDTSCAVLTNGQARCWGVVTGDGTSFTRDYAVPVVAP